MGRRLNKINEALEVLDEVTEEKADEVKTLINRDYHNLKKVLKDLGPEVEHNLKEITENSLKGIEESAHQAKQAGIRTAKNVDRTVHERPWQVIGGAALASGLFGYIMGRFSDKKRR